MELINCFHGDPVVLFSTAEMKAELQRWNVAVPVRTPDEPEQLYAHRLRVVSDIISGNAVTQQSIFLNQISEFVASWPPRPLI